MLDSRAEQSINKMILEHLITPEHLKTYLKNDEEKHHTLRSQAEGAPTGQL